MTGDELTPDLVADLLRSAWIVERARALVYEDWAAAEARFRASSQRALERAELLEGALRATGGAPDPDLVADHTTWMTQCAGGPLEPFADLFALRLAQWVDAHALVYLPRPTQDRMRALSAAEEDTLSWPQTAAGGAESQPLVASPPARTRDTSLRIGVLGDLHLGAPGAERHADAAVADLNAARCDVVVQLGDLTDHGDPGEFQAAANVLAAVEAPLLVTLGNHDAYSCSEQRMAGRELFQSFFGREPDGLVARHGAWHIAVLDSVEYSMSPFDAFDLVAGTFVEGLRGAVVRGALSEAQHDLLADIASPGAPPAFVFLHHPPQPFTGFPPVIFGLRDTDSGRLHAMCDSGNVWGVFCGHTHRNRRGRGFDAVPTQEVAAPRDWPCGYALIDARACGFDYRFVQLSDRDAVRGAHERAGGFVRRYALGSPSDRAFAWSP